MNQTLNVLEKGRGVLIKYQYKNKTKNAFIVIRTKKESRGSKEHVFSKRKNSTILSRQLTVIKKQELDGLI